MSQNNETVDPQVLKKYEISKKLGKGAYGIVWRAIEKKTKKTVALKKIYDAFQNATDAQRTFREIIFLQNLCDHDNIVKLTDVMKADNDNDIYLVFEYMGAPLLALSRFGVFLNACRRSSADFQRRTSTPSSTPTFSRTSTSATSCTSSSAP